MGIRIALVTVTAALVLCCPTPALAQDTVSNISLTYEALKSPALTPTSVHGSSKNAFRIGAATGKLAVAASELEVRLRPKGRSLYIGVDGDGDATIAEEDYRKLTFDRAGRSEPLTFKIRAEGADSAVTLIDVRPVLDASRSFKGIEGRYVPGGCMKGRFGDTPIRLVDDNVDGRFTQDGRDILVVGPPAAAGVPLLKIHRIGKGHFELKVAESGERIELFPVSDRRLGTVKTPLPAAVLKCLVLADKDGAYDVVAAGAIPAGDYRLQYGLLADARSALAILPGPDAVTYTIQPGGINTLRIGKPFRPDFGVKRSGAQVQVLAPTRAVGAGGEVYRPLIFSGGESNASAPKVRLTVAGRTLAVATMQYDKAGGLSAYSGTAANELLAERVVADMAVATRTPLGRLVGSKDVEGRWTGKSKPPADVPAVAVAAVKPTKTPPGRKPTKTPPRRKPTATKPSGKPPSTRPAPSGGDTAEKKAARLLALGRNYLASNVKALAAAKFREIIEKYPGTKAAKEAEELLAECQ